jgi:hypothetical protein
MTNKVREFPKPVTGPLPINEPIVLFSLGGRRFAIEWIVTELNPKPAEVVPIWHPRKTAKRARSAQRDL